MSRYDNCSREELLRRIEELEAQLDTPKGSGSRFRERYACKILDSIPDMLTVLDRDGTLVELVPRMRPTMSGFRAESSPGRTSARCFRLRPAAM